MEQIVAWTTAFRDMLWSAYFLVPLLVGTGLLMTVRLKFVQVRKLGHSVNLTRGLYDHPDDPGEVTHFQALSSALSSTVGTGNIAGVATAIASGGPGAIFWMWITGILGMATKFTECTLAVRYREITDDGVVRGGPMYYISKGLAETGNPLFARLGTPLGHMFAFCVSISAIVGSGLVQANSAAAALHASFDIPEYITGIVMALLVGSVIIGGIKRIGAVTSRLVPIMATLYTIAILMLLFTYWHTIPDAISMIFYYAFNPMAAVGGFAGATVNQALSLGASRGAFSNEAGLGTAPIAHAAAKTKEPVREGLVAMMEPLIDTLGINTLTALAILTTGVWQSGESGAVLTSNAFDQGLPGQGGYIVGIALFMFGTSTSITQAYYGNRAMDFLFGRRPAELYRWLYAGLHVFGAVAALQFVWTMADIANGLIALPNLLALIMLSGYVTIMAKKYFAEPQERTI